MVSSRTLGARCRSIVISSGRKRPSPMSLMWMRKLRRDCSGSKPADSLRACSMVTSARRIGSARRLAFGVGWTPPLARMNKGSWISARSLVRPWLAAGCVKASSSAARLTLRVRYTASNSRSRLRSISLICIAVIPLSHFIVLIDKPARPKLPDHPPETLLEISFGKEIESLRLGAGQTFHGEGILAITKALLQSGVAYVGGYQGAPVSHLLDVMVQARSYMDELGVHVEACANEASAAAMLGASIHYPLRGAVTWKSIVGTNVAADALSNLASPGVTGGALIVVGEDYGEGASVIQERTHAYALKSTLLLLDPRPELTTMVNSVEHAFALSEASNMPAILELRIRACHVRGSFECKDNVAPKHSPQALIDEPAGFDYMRLAHPPVTFRHEKLKV